MPQGGGRTLAAVLFTDMVDSTAIAEELGDRRWKALVDAHHRIVRRELKRFGGTELDTAGDGFFASFKEPASAITAACAIAETVRELGVEIRAGVHFGECERIGKKLGGITVVVGARIMALGGAGDVLVSSTAAELARGAGFGFEDRGMRTLKGVEGDWRVFAATTVDGAPRQAPLEPGAARALRDGLVVTPPARRGRRMAIVAGVIALAVIAAVIVVPRLGGGGPTTIRPNAIGVFDRHSGELLDTVDVGNRPSAVAVTDDAIWVANADDASVWRIDSSTRQVVDRILVGGDPEALTVGFGAVWVANAGDRSVFRIDPATNTAQRIAVGNGPLAITSSPTGIWVANSIDGTVQRIDPDLSVAEPPIEVGASPGGIAADATDIWVANRADGTLSEIDAASGATVRARPVGTDPTGVVATGDSVWVTNRSDGTVSMLQTSTDSLTATDVGEDPVAIAASEDDRWVASGSDGSIWQLSPDASPMRTIQVGAAPSALAIDEDQIWVAAVASAGSAHRGGTLTVSAAFAPDSIDPAFSYEPTSWEILTMTNDGLVGYRKTGGVAGAALVADLATSIPTPTDGGRTYTFQLRPNISYSDGTPVRPEDFRTSLARVLTMPGTARPDFYSAIRGAPACLSDPSSCDLSEGIETDNVAGTVSFHLTAPDPNFLHKLALPFAFAVPSSTPDRTHREARQLRTALPATGPYAITAYDGQSLTLERNASFRLWSAAAQPDGLPDRIEWEFGLDPERAIRQVEDGVRDVWDGPIPSALVSELTTRFSAQTHVSTNVRALTTFFALNTRIAPFDNVQARRAVNFALDRRRLVEISGGPPLAQVNCQVLPPNLPGYRPYCPYTVDPSPSGDWTAPDFARAQRLVDASGTGGASVDVLTFHLIDPGGLAGKSVVDLLTQLGYDARLHDFGDDFEAGFRTGSDSSNGAEVALYAWQTDYLAPSSFIVDLLTCDAFVPNDPYNTNLAGFCDRRIDAEVRRALELQTRDPAGADDQWAKVDRMITDQAPLLPLALPQAIDLVSPRVGNFQRHPQWGVLFDQLWVV